MCCAAQSIIRNQKQNCRIIPNKTVENSFTVIISIVVTDFIAGLFISVVNF